MKNQDLRQSESSKSFSLLRPRSIGSGTTTSPDPEVGLGEFEPTETEEFSETDHDDSPHVIVATQVDEETIKEQQHQQRRPQQPQRAQQQFPTILPFSGKKEQQQQQQQQLPIIPPLRGSHRVLTKGKKEEERATTPANANASLDADGTLHTKSTSSTPLLSVQELTDLLHEVNQDATVYRNKRRHRRVPTHVDVNDDTVHDVEDPPRPHLLKLDDMTSVLKHINMAEEAKRPIRWDLISEMTAVVYGGARNQPKYADAHDTQSTGDDGTASFESTSREILTMMLGHDESVCGDSGETIDADGYPLNPSAYTCASSVTWFDSSLYEEIEITDDECDFYEEIVVDDENDNSCVSLY
jgi:hypothetical protein